MPARKIRVEVFDSEGNRYTVAFEGQVTREKTLRLLDMVELLGGMQTGTANQSANLADGTVELSKYDKLRMVVQKHFPVVWFSSKEVQLVYEQELREPLSLSTVATYLARMANRGILVKTGASNRLKYKTVSNAPQAMVRQTM